MKTPDKQWSVEKDKDRNKAERDKAKEHAARQQQSEDGGNRQQGGWEPEQSGAGRKPPSERDRDYDPDGERIGPERES